MEEDELLVSIRYNPPRIEGVEIYVCVGFVYARDDTI